MKDIINYYYNFDATILDEKEKYTSLKNDDDFYYFVFYNRSKDELDDTLKIIDELRYKGINVHNIIYNRFNSCITMVGNNNYVMLKINGNKDEQISFIDMINNSDKCRLNKNNSKLYRNNWAFLWSTKEDYYEYQINELGIDKEIVLNTFSYYVGLCENAISYVNKINKVVGISENDVITLSRKRVFFPNTFLNYYNPLSFIFDLNVRDIAEYLKISFFNNENALLDLITFLKSKKITNYSYHMLYARLLYPSYYFDVLDSIMNDNYSEKNLIKIINKQKDYELFLKQAYIEINKYTNLERVDWLLKE